MPTAVADDDASPLGILAGGSGVPCEIAEAVTRRGRHVHIVGLEGEAEPGIAAYPHTWVNWGGVGAMLRAFRDSGCRELVIVGRVRRPNLLSLRPDIGFWSALPKLLPVLRGGDDAILRMVVGFFEKHDLRVVGAHEAAPELLATSGVLGTCKPTRTDLQAVTAGAAALSALGPFDAAQAVVVHAHGLLAVEGADGTDAMLRRIADRSGSLGMRRQRAQTTDGAILVKLPKPQQERRIDMPAIGPETIRRAAAAGLAGIAVRSGETLIAERREALRLANDAGIFLIGLASSHLAADPPHPGDGETLIHPPSPVEGLKPLTRRKPAQRHLDDASLGAQLIAALEPFWEQSAAVVSRGYVLVTEGPGGAIAAAERAGRVKPWGTRLMRRKSGVLVMSAIEGELGYDPALMIRQIHASGLAGVAILRTPKDEATLATLRTAADSAGLFLVAPGDAR